MFDKIFRKKNEKENENIVFMAVRYDREDDYKKYINFIDINILDGSEELNLIQVAIARKNFKYIEDLLKKGINVNHGDHKGLTAMHYLGWFSKDVELAKELINYGGDLSIIDKFGNNPLWYAVFYAKGNYDLVRFYLEKGADPLNKNKSGRSALDFAKQLKDEALIKILTKSEG